MYKPYLRHMADLKCATALQNSNPIRVLIVNMGPGARLKRASLKSVPFNGGSCALQREIRALQWAFSKIVVEEQKLGDSGFFLSCFKSGKSLNWAFFSLQYGSR